MRLGAPLPSRGPAYDPELPTPGCFRVRLRKGAPDSAVRIWLGHPNDPETGEEMTERPFHWQASLNGARVPLDQCWPGCARDRISQAEHDAIVERNRTMNPDSPFFDARKPIDIGRAPPPF